MKKVTLVVRILLGLIFAASGISYFFITPPPLEGPMADFMNGLMATHYFIYLLKGTEALCGILLLAGIYVPLALVVLAPIILNIFLINAFMAPSGLPIAFVIGILESYLAFFSAEYSPTVKSLFKMK